MVIIRSGLQTFKERKNDFTFGFYRNLDRHDENRELEDVVEKQLEAGREYEAAVKSGQASLPQGGILLESDGNLIIYLNNENVPRIAITEAKILRDQPSFFFPPNEKEDLIETKQSSWKPVYEAIIRTIAEEFKRGFERNPTFYAEVSYNNPFVEAWIQTAEDSDRCFSDDLVDSIEQVLTIIAPNIGIAVILSGKERPLQSPYFGYITEKTYGLLFTYNDREAVKRVSEKS